MAQYRIDNLAELARQLAFTPRDARFRQLNAAEELLHSIEPGKGYPIEFVIFRITGYHPKSARGHLLTGLALQHDLGLLIEQVSQTLDLSVEQTAQPVLSVDDVSEHFNVTSKTIQRWRRKGLPARRFVFPDGKRRVGFLLSSVERFFTVHADLAPICESGLLISAEQSAKLLRRARQLASRGSSLDELTRRLGRKFGRSPAAVLHLIQQFDRQNPQQAIAVQLRPDPAARQRRQMNNGYRRGKSLGLLARKFRCPRSLAYRAVLDERIDRLTRRRVKFIDDPLYHQSDALTALAIIADPCDDLSARSSDAEGRLPRDLPPYFAELYRTPLLSPVRERALFLELNFHKCRFVAARRKLDPRFARHRQILAMEQILSDVSEAKNDIVRANLRLVVKVARQHLRPGMSLMELVSEGNIILLRAVDSFDVHRGHRFSTYATFALMKGFARIVPQLSVARAVGEDTGRLAEIPDHAARSAGDHAADREQVSHLLATLTARERLVLQSHFGLNAGRLPATLDQVGQSLGISRQRVRQIERAAMDKLRKGTGSGL